MPDKEMKCEIVDDTISYLKGICREKNEEIKIQQKEQDAAYAIDDWELITKMDFELVNLRFEHHSRLKALETLKRFKENYQCE